MIRVLIFIIFFLFLETILRQITALPNTLPLESIYISLILSLLFTYATKLGKIVLFIFLLLVVTVQISNAFFYGSWIDPMNIYLLFSNMEEVLHIIPQLQTNVLIQSGLLILFSVILMFIYFKKSSLTFTHRWVSGLIVVLILFQPIRDGLLKPEKIEKRFTKDTHGVIRSSYNTFSIVVAMKLNDIFGSQLYEDYLHDGHERSIDFGKKDVNFVIYYGESLSSKYMSLYGYKKETTPFLDGVKKEYPYSLVKEAIAGSTATAVSTKRFFNLIPRPDGSKQVQSSNTSLFKYAKEASFNTAYVTTQAINYINHIIRKIGKPYMDSSLTPSEFNKSKYGYKDYANDIELLYMYDSLDLKRPYFLAIQPFGSHAVFSERTYAKDKAFGKGGNILEYENTVHYTDTIVKKIITKLQNDSKEKPWVFFMTSDHGTYMTEKIITRSFKYPASYMVPFVAITNDKEIYEKYIEPLEKCDILFHQQIAETSAMVLGYNVPLSVCDEGVILAGLMNGTGGTKKVEVIDAKAVLKPY